MPSQGKRKSATDCDKRKQLRTSFPYSPIEQDSRECPSHIRLVHTPTQQRVNDEPKDVGGVEVQVCCTDTRARIAPSPINVVTSFPQNDVWSRNTTQDTIHLSTTPRPVRTEATTTEDWSQANMPRRKRLNYGNGLDVFSQDSPVRGLRHMTDEIGEAGSAIAAKTERRVNGGTIQKDS